MKRSSSSGDIATRALELLMLQLMRSQAPPTGTSAMAMAILRSLPETDSTDPAARCAAAVPLFSASKKTVVAHRRKKAAASTATTTAKAAVAAASAKHPRKEKKARARAEVVLTAAAFQSGRKPRPVIRYGYA
ncbi:hypothetical protein EDC01DRAFT_776406 [Geopyxis carbonaria]|nr:hypothetical protein EDC01DRAFT_776406 [Geopyxis carbonaria]